MPKVAKQCMRCGLVVGGKKNRRRHEQVCTREKPARKQHFVLFHLPERVVNWDIPDHR